MTDVIVVEEKLIPTLYAQPKWGFLPSPSHLSAASRDIKARHCRFCMHTSLKAEQAGTDSIAHTTRYCPLDLYSGDEARVGAAVEALWAGWLATGGKANNLRLFYNGERLTPDPVRRILLR